MDFGRLKSPQDRVEMADQALGAIVLLSEEEASLSNQIIVDYFTSDYPRVKRLDSSELEPERVILDENSGDEQLRQSGEIPTGTKTSEVREPERLLSETETDNSESEIQGSANEEILTWEVALTVVVVTLALAHCMWMWNLVELSTLSLDFGDYMK